MTESREVTITGSELVSAARKLEKFGREQMTPNEQIVLDWLVQRAASAPVDDPEGNVKAYLSAAQLSPTRSEGFSRRFTQALGYGPGITHPGDLAAVRIIIEF